MNDVPSAPAPPPPLAVAEATTAVAPLTASQLAIITAARLIITVAYRILYVLLPFLSGQLQVSQQTISGLVTAQVAASLLSPLGGALADTRGGRATMNIGLILFALGSGLCAISTSFGGFVVGYALIGLAIALYQPAAQAYLSARTPYQRRGFVLGVFEFSWAGSALLGVAPLMVLVQATGSAAPAFAVLAVVSLGALLLMRAMLPPGHVAHRGARQRFDWAALRVPPVLAMLAMLILTMAAVDFIFVIQSAWLKTAFGANEAQLGQVAGLLGVAELVGVSAATLLIDRLGKKRAALFGFAATGVAVALLPLSNGVWLLALALLFVFDMCFEFAIVSAFPLASGIAPHVRGTVMALSVAAVGLGRTIGSQFSAPLWQGYGIVANSLCAAALLGVGVLVCALFVREAEA